MQSRAKNILQALQSTELAKVSNSHRSKKVLNSLYHSATAAVCRVCVCGPPNEIEKRKKWWIARWNWHESWLDDRHTMMAAEELCREHFPFPSGKILISLTLFTSSRTAAGFTPGPKGVAHRRDFSTLIGSSFSIQFTASELTHTRHDEKKCQSDDTCVACWRMMTPSREE